MSATLYDNALLKKIKNWVRDSNIRITGPDETRRVFEYRADQNNDKPIELPLIALSRDSEMEIKDTQKKPLTYDGERILKSQYINDKNKTERKVMQLNAIPIKLSYQIDIYTRYFEEGEEYVRNFIFNLINYPKMQIELPYNNCKEIKNCSISLNSTVSDNSSVSERLIPGQFTRKTISISINDAYLWDTRTRTAATICEEPYIDITTDVELDTQISTDIDIKKEK